MLITEKSIPKLIVTKNNMIRLYRYFAIALIALFSNVALGQFKSTLVKNVTCNGGNNGWIKVKMDNSQDYEYNINGGPTQSDSIFSNLVALPPANFYVVGYKLKSSGGAFTTVNVSLTEPSAITVSFPALTLKDVTCNGGNNGEVFASVSGGHSGYKYSWNTTPVLTTASITGLVANNYTVNITDDSGCTGNNTVTIKEPAKITSTASQTDVLCNGKSTGALNITATGGSGAYVKYTWTSTPASYSSSIEDITGLAAGTYNVEIEDNKGCKGTSSYTITEPSAISATPTVTNLTCFNNNSGAISLSVSGGTPGFTYQWSGPVGFSEISKDVTALAADNTYSVKVTDANSCELTLSSIVVTEPTKLSISEVVTAVDCNGAATGEIDVTTAGGTTPYAFQWDDAPINSTTEDLTSLKAGDYEITVVDDNGCTEIKTITVSEPSIIGITETHIDNLCNGDALGTIDVTVTGGTVGSSSAYTFEWTQSGNPVAITEDLSNLSAGTYDLQVTDDNSCIMNLSVAISEPTLISANGLVTDAKCYKGNDGEIIMSISGGTVGGSSNYVVSWTGPNSYVSSIQDINTLFAGDYNYTIVDDNNCQITGKLTVGEPSELVLTTTPSSICDGSGQITFSATGGTSATGDYTFEVDGVTSTSPLVNLFDNVYIVKAIDDNACEDTIHTIVKHVDPILPTVKTQMKVVYLNASGNASITTADVDNASTDNCGVKSLSLDKLTFDCSNVGQNIVTLTVTDINDNINSDTVSVFVRDTISPTLTLASTLIAIDTSGSAYLTAGLVITSTADNCGVKDTVLSKSVFGLADVGNNVIDVTITDKNGNSTSKKVTVNVYIADSDKDSIPDYIEKNLDTDGDGTMNYLDLDSDNDAISDLVENDSMKSYTGQDFDGDGIPNALDLDSDDDGINDIVEVDLGDMDANGNGQTDNPIVVGLPNDKDGDGMPDYLDLDSDGDGIFDVVESLEKYVDANTDGKVDGIDTDNDGIKDAADGFNGWADASDKRPANSDNDLTEDWRDTDSDNDLIADATESTVDTDGDLTPNYLDTDSDDDGISDLIETATDSDTDGKGNYIDTDSDEDGILDKIEGTADPDGDTKGNWLDDDSDGDGISDKIETDSDADNDTNPNYLDTDSDGDGILDQEEGTADPDGDSKGNWLDDDSDADGISDLNETNADYDGDGIKNYLDDDSDDDELKDAAEGELDLDKNGKKDFLDPQYVIPEGFSPNGDGVNDIFYITGLRVYKEAQFIVINQWGQVVFESDLGYGNNWDGTFGGSGLKFGSGVVPEGIYYFVFKPNKFNMPNITGNIYIKP